jgi:hypothetical protein
MKILPIIIIGTLIYFTAHSQKDFLKWGDNVKIKWTDFKGEVETNSPFAAMSAVGIHYKYNSSIKGKLIKVSFDIDAAFDKTKSWSKKSQRSAGTLRHEQLHFDICEVVGRQFKKEAEKTVYSKNFKNEIIRIFNRYTRYLQKFQKKYDDQTRHSNNKLKQKEWENLIRHELLKKY